MTTAKLTVAGPGSKPPEIRQKIIVCADDFGMGAGIDTGIMQLASQNRLQAASCLTEGPTFKAHAHELASTGIQTGLHLNFTEPLGLAGFYLPLSTLIRRAYFRALDTGQIRDQIKRQLDRFEDTLGCRPDFVDGHQHVHQLPQIREELLQILSGRYGVCPQLWLRHTRAAALATVPLRYRAKAMVIQALGARALAHGARQAGFSLNERFTGVYDFQGGQATYRRLLPVWLASLAGGGVLMCHPAAYADTADPLGAQRVAEYNVLARQEAGFSGETK